MTSLFSVGSEDWWRLRRLKLSGVSDLLVNPNGFKVIETSEPLESKPLLQFIKERYLELGIIDKNWQLPPLKGRFFAVYHPESPYPGAVALLVEKDLPAKKIYSKELKKIQGWRKRLAEITLLATHPKLKAKNAIFIVFKNIYRYSLRKGITDLVVCINPKHTDFYEKILLFERKGARKPHSFIPGLPVILEHLDLKKAKEKYLKIYSSFPEELNLYHFFEG
ncbi:N-acyl amino acid synthase FeeM domain-containing protein [Thermodesulfatator indicus]